MLGALLTVTRAIQEIRDYLSKKESEDEVIKPNSAVDSVKEDELARDQSRQEANLTLDQENLTTLQDSVMPEKVSLPAAGQTFGWSQPTFDQILGRLYKVLDTSWSYTQTQDSVVAVLDISKALFNIQTLFDRIKRYRYWRSGIKIKLQVNSTQFHYGSLFAAIVPFYTPSEQIASAIDQTTYGLSGIPCSGILSANTGKPLELECPFQVPNEYLDITQADDVRPFYLIICVMNPLKIAGGAINPSLNLSVFAQFTDIKLLGPSEITANSKSTKSSKADMEQRNATKQGTLGKVAGAVSDVASSLSTIPVIGSIASAVAPISKAVGSIFDYFGWDKPTNISSQVFMTTRPMRGLQHGSGQDPSETLALKPEQKVSTEAEMFGYNDPATRSFLKLLQTPMWVGSFTIANNQVVNNVFKRLFIRPYAPDIQDSIPTETQRHDYLSFYSQFFNSCRGGYRYFFHFDTSTYTTARIRITFEPSNAAVAAVTDGGDSFSRIIDVNGATTIGLDVPYCYPSARMPVIQNIVQNGPANGQLLLSLINPIQSNGSADVIFCNVFRCAADDFRFYQPHKYKVTKQYVPPGLSESIRPNSISTIFNNVSSVSLGDGPKILYDRTTEDEEVDHINTFLHRYHLADTTGANGIVPLNPMAGDPYRFLSSFRVYRGSVRIVPQPTVATMRGLVIDLNDTGNENVISTGAYFNGSSSTDVPIEFPYNNNIKFCPLRMAADNFPDGYGRYALFQDKLTMSTLWSAGDDFTVGLRKHPNLVTVAIP